MLRPDSSLRKKSWRLKVKVVGPKRRTAPAAYVLVDQRKGKDEKRYVKLSRQGRATVKVDFSARKVKKVTAHDGQRVRPVLVLPADHLVLPGQPARRRADVHAQAVVRK